MTHQDYLELITFLQNLQLQFAPLLKLADGRLEAISVALIAIVGFSMAFNSGLHFGIRD
jgi:hypothetical protein